MIIAPMTGIAFFCFGGTAYGLWCHVHALRARRAVDKLGCDSDRYRELRRRVLPSNRSIGLQVAIGVLAAIITAVQW